MFKTKISFTVMAFLFIINTICQAEELNFEYPRIYLLTMNHRF